MNDTVIQVVLERAKFAVAKRLSHEFATPTTVKATLEQSFMFDELCVMLVQHIAKQKITEEHVVAVWPEDWWQAFKQRFAPVWFLRRWPVKMTGKTAIFEVAAYYPKIALPDQKNYIHILKTGENEYRP